jgi:hypothetical protein
MQACVFPSCTEALGRVSMSSSLAEVGHLACQIRSYALDRVARELRAATPDRRTSLFARDVARALELADRFPGICSALDTNIFKDKLREQGLAMVSRDGPRQSSTARWMFARSAPTGSTEMQEQLSPENSKGTPSPRPLAAKRLRFTLAGQTFEKQRNDFIMSIADKQPGSIRKYSTSIKGVPYPIRQVVSSATGLPPIAITSQEAFRVLVKFAFTIDIHES